MRRNYGRGHNGGSDSTWSFSDSPVRGAGTEAGAQANQRKISSLHKIQSILVIFPLLKAQSGSVFSEQAIQSRVRYH